MARPKTKKRAARRNYSRKQRPFFAYPLTTFILLCVGVFLVAWTLRANAVNIKVTARIPGPPVTTPAVINTPTSGQHFSAIPITVAGTCPANAAYVEIFRNNIMSGSASCDGSSNFQLSMDLFPGQNDLVAHSFNITDDEGPVSTTVTVFYDAPKPVPKPPSGQGGGNQDQPTTIRALRLETAFVYKGYFVGEEVEWPIGISGGIQPYAISVDWGDGSSDVISRGKPGEFTINHTYNKAGGYLGSYEVKIKASDAKGNKAYIQFFVIVSDKTEAGAASIFSKSPPQLGSGLNWLWVAWPAYLVVVLMTFSYLLGEREELITLRKRGLLKQRSRRAA